MRKKKRWIFWSSVRPSLLPHSVSFRCSWGSWTLWLFLTFFQICSGIVEQLGRYVSALLATCRRYRNSVAFSAGSKVIFLNFPPKWNSNIFTSKKDQEKSAWLWPLLMPLDFPAEGQGCNDTFFGMKSRPRSLTTATPGAASTCHELQAWQFWGVFRSLILSPWTQETLIWTEVPWAAHMKAFATISRILNRAQGIWKLDSVPAQGTLATLASSAVHQLRYWKTCWFTGILSNLASFY